MRAIQKTTVAVRRLLYPDLMLRTRPVRPITEEADDECLPRVTRVADVARASREAGVAFVSGSPCWGRRDLAEWLMTIGPLAVRFVSIPSLIRMKEIADRPQDKIDIEYLRKLADAGK